MRRKSDPEAMPTTITIEGSPAEQTNIFRLLRRCGLVNHDKEITLAQAEMFTSYLKSQEENELVIDKKLVEHKITESFHIDRIRTLQVILADMDRRVRYSEEMRTFALDKMNEWVRKWGASRVQVYEMEEWIEDLVATVEERDRTIEDLELTIVGKYRQIGRLMATIRERYPTFGDLEATIEERDRKIEHLEATVEERDRTNDSVVDQVVMLEKRLVSTEMERGSLGVCRVVSKARIAQLEQSNEGLEEDKLKLEKGKLELEKDKLELEKTVQNFEEKLAGTMGEESKKRTRSEGVVDKDEKATKPTKH